MKELAWLDGVVLPAAEARIPALSRAVLYGEGLFETLRIYDGIPGDLEAHLERMAASARELGIDLPPGVERAAEELLRSTGALEGVLRVSALAGVGETSHLLLTLRALPADLEREQIRGISATTARAGSLPLAAHKTTSYLRMVAATRATRARETILLDDEGRVLEGTRSNVFAVLGDELVTPPLGRILPGIVRRRVLELARQVSLTPMERLLGLEELAAARAVAITNAVIEIVPVVGLDGRPVGNGEPDAVVSRLRALYRTRVAGIR